ncbi:MAG: helix-turn-helix transcriptional regulator [Fimbriimonadaceae bacterium]|nr:helix-turn-helix transcriptional regulator [Fimbriimonadaceae bacterium]
MVYPEPMAPDDAMIARLAKGLSDPTRVRMVRFLKARSRPVAVDDHGNVHRFDGVTVGDVCCHLTGSDRPNSLVSHHLRELRQAGWVRSEKRGKKVVCELNPEAAGLLRAFLDSQEADPCR